MFDFFEPKIDWSALGEIGAIFLGAIVVGFVLHLLFWRLLRGFARHTSSIFDDALVTHCRKPTTPVFPILVIYLVIPFVGQRISESVLDGVGQFLMVLFTLSVAWTAVRLTSVVEDVLLDRYDITVRDNRKARRIQTQFQIVRKIIVVAITILAGAVVLMSFEQFRQLGAGILASAGIMGLVVGLAAQKTLGNLLAGIQLAITQPVSLDDVVVIEGEWGRIEEITLTYVVFKIWDLRRLIIPISYFLEKPFENWTRTSADVLGTIYIYADYSVPVDALREELQRIVKASDSWDGNLATVLVTNATEQTVEVRALISAEDSSKQWDLRCLVREKLITFLQEKYPESLPKVRAEFRADKSGSSPVKT